MQSFVVPVANINATQSEALHQIMDNLNHLNMIVNEAVTTIHHRIQQESELLSSISHRVQEAYKKTSHVASNVHKSTTVYSSSTYPKIQSEPGVDCHPLLNKTGNDSSPMKPSRANYNLSLKQRNESPANVDTLRLLHSVNKYTQPSMSKADRLQTCDIPQWISSVADCVIFDTNCCAYKSSKNRKTDRTHRRYKKQKKRGHHRPNKYGSLADAPPSIADRCYNMRTQRKTYGERIKYRCVLDRENMPKFKMDFNVFDDTEDVKAVDDIRWNHQEIMEEGFIPSDVLNAIDIPFEYGDDAPPPVKVEVATNNVNEIKTTHDVVDKEEECENVSDKEEEQQIEATQPLVDEDDSHDKSLLFQPEEDEDIAIDIRSEHDDGGDDEGGIVRLAVDDNALQNAIANLKPREVTTERNNSGKELIWEQMEKRRKYYTDTDEEDESSSFD